MTLRFLIDAQLPPRLAAALRARGHGAEHVTEIGLGAATDSVIAAHAFAAGAVIVTKDADFVTLGRHDEALQVVWVRFGNASWAALSSRLLPILPHIEAALREGERLVEVR